MRVVNLPVLPLTSLLFHNYNFGPCLQFLKWIILVPGVDGLIIAVV